MDNFRTEMVESDLEMVESDLEMDINFQTKKRNCSLGKRHRDDEKEVFDDKEVSDVQEVTDVQESSIVLRPYGHPDYGDRLMEVFRVTFHRGGNLSGKILINDNSNTHQYVYRSEHSQYIKDGGDLLLTALNRAAIAIDDILSVFWNLNLTNPSEHQPKRITNYCKDCFDDDDGDFSPGHSEPISFNYFGQTYLYHRPLYEELKDEDGQVCATVMYAFFNEAMQADIEVSLILIDEKIKGVYGSITAKNDMIVDPLCESFLFLKEDSSQSVEVVDGQPIPLPRCVVAVPLKSNLIVCAHLKSKDADTEFKADISFGVELRGKSEKLINNIQVRVTWKRFWDV